MKKKSNNFLDPQLLQKIIKKNDIKDIKSAEGLFSLIKKQIIEVILTEEMKDVLGYEKHSKEPKEDSNRRNGSYSKNIVDDHGNQISISIPRDREGEYEPLLIQKGTRRLPGFNEKVMQLYARGMSVRDIQEHIRELYEVEISPELISNITDAVLEEIKKWQTRLLDKVYPIVFMDCLYVKGRSDHGIINKAVYLVVGINMEGEKELLGIWISESEGSKFWMQVCTDLQNRGVEQIYIVCVDGLKGFPEAINSIFPNTTVQLCIVHLIRNSMKYVSYKDRKEVCKDLKSIYSAINEEEAKENLEKFKSKWTKKYPVIPRIWEQNWDRVIPLFRFTGEIRRVIYTTNTIESINRQIRKIIKTKGLFPTDNSIKKILYLSLRNASKKWTRPIRNWPLALNQLQIMYGEERM